MAQTIWTQRLQTELSNFKCQYARRTGLPYYRCSYKIIEKNGVRIGVLGLTTQYIPHWEQPDHIKGWKFEPALKAAQKYVPELRKKADIVVVAYHGGLNVT